MKSLLSLSRCLSRDGGPLSEDLLLDELGAMSYTGGTVSMCVGNDMLKRALLEFPPLSVALRPAECSYGGGGGRVCFDLDNKLDEPPLDGYI